MLMRDDLPTLDLPMKANSGNFCFGFSEILVLLPAKSASVTFIKFNIPNQSAKIEKFLLFLWNDALCMGFFAKFVTAIKRRLRNKNKTGHGKGTY
jgi:hypothetical protein